MTWNPDLVEALQNLLLSGKVKRKLDEYMGKLKSGEIKPNE